MPQQPSKGWEEVEETPGWTPVEQARAYSSISSKTPPESKTPGFFKRLAQGVGLPSSEEELKAAEKSARPGVGEVVAGPAYTAGKLLHGYGKNLYQQAKESGTEAYEAGQAIGQGLPKGPQVGKAASAGYDLMLKGFLSPVGGGALSAFGEDIHEGNYMGAAGSAVAVLFNALMLKGSTKLPTKQRIAKISYAADLPEAMDASKQLRAVLPDLDRVASGKAPSSVGELLNTVKQAKDNMNNQAGQAMFPIRGKQRVPLDISNAIKGHITSDMEQTAAGRSMANALKKAAVDFEKPWTYEQLDAARMNANSRLRAYFKKSSLAQYADVKTDMSVIVDKEVARGVQDIVYPEMDRAAGKPPGYFLNLKQRQGTLMQLEDVLNDQVKSLTTRTAKIAGSPRLSQENVSLYQSHLTGAPGGSIHKVQNIILRQNPLKQANRAVARSFAGRPIPKAMIWSLPIRTMLFQPQEEPEPVKNRKEALDLLRPTAQ